MFYAYKIQSIKSILSIFLAIINLISWLLLENVSCIESKKFKSAPDIQ